MLIKRVAKRITCLCLNYTLSSKVKLILAHNNFYAKEIIVFLLERIRRLRKKMRDIQRAMDVYWDDRIVAIILVAVIEKKMSQ